MTLTAEQERSYRRMMRKLQAENANSDGSALCDPSPEQIAWLAAIEYAGAIQVHSFRPLELINVAAIRLGATQKELDSLRSRNSELVEGIKKLADKCKAKTLTNIMSREVDIWQAMAYGEIADELKSLLKEYGQ